MELWPKYDRDNSGIIEASKIASFMNDVFRRLGVVVAMIPLQQAISVIIKNNDDTFTKDEIYVALV